MPKESLNIDYWKELSENPPELFKRLFKFEEEYLEDLIKKGSKILNVGCGIGRTENYLINKGGIFYGVDNDSDAVITARESLSTHPNISISLGDGRNLDYRDSTFDYVLCLGTPANFGNERNQFYSEMRRVLKHDGEVVIAVYNEDAFEERKKAYDFAGPENKRIEGTTFFGDNPFPIVSEQFSKEQLEEIFDENGFVPTDITKDGIGYFCILEKVNKDLLLQYEKEHPYGGWMPIEEL